MDNKINKQLFDIKESVDLIKNYLGEKRDFNVYKSDKMLRKLALRIAQPLGIISLLTV
ncbi:MAG: hypothetical protein U9N51_03790 [Bacteroidota bacterium]|nr:hypothetical protein [Bacteroidota bacterium]